MDTGKAEGREGKGRKEERRGKRKKRIASRGQTSGKKNCELGLVDVMSILCSRAQQNVRCSFFEQTTKMARSHWPVTHVWAAQRAISGPFILAQTYPKPIHSFRKYVNCPASNLYFRVTYLELCALPECLALRPGRPLVRDIAMAKVRYKAS